LRASRRTCGGTCRWSRRAGGGGGEKREWKGREREREGGREVIACGILSYESRTGKMPYTE
jgi:hypothetical protein